MHNKYITKSVFEFLFLLGRGKIGWFFLFLSFQRDTSPWEGKNWVNPWEGELALSIFFPLNLKKMQIFF
jgi:hypothetical protein